MATCSSCGKSIGILTTVVIDANRYCTTCSVTAQDEKNKIKAEQRKSTTETVHPVPSTKTNSKDYYEPDSEAIRRALSALLTQDPDTRKLFDAGSRTYVKLFGGDINNFVNLNANLIQASIMLKMLEKLESIEQKLEQRHD